MLSLRLILMYTVLLLLLVVLQVEGTAPYIFSVTIEMFQQLCKRLKRTKRICIQLHL